MEPVDCVDASVVLEAVFEDEEKCKQYLNTIGYKLRNKGMLTVLLIGEIFSNLFIKVSQKMEDPFERKVVIQNVVDFFDDTLIALLQKERLTIAKIKGDDYQHVKKIRELDYKITADDAFHLSAAVSNQCQRFITIDRYLLNDHFRALMKREFGLIIAAP